MRGETLDAILKLILTKKTPSSELSRSILARDLLSGTRRPDRAEQWDALQPELSRAPLHSSLVCRIQYTADWSAGYTADWSWDTQLTGLGIHSSLVCRIHSSLVCRVQLTGLQDTQLTGLQDTQLTGLQGTADWSWDTQLTGLQGTADWSWDTQLTGLQDTITQLTGLQGTGDWSPGYR